MSQEPENRQTHPEHELETAIAARLLDQCALDARVLSGLATEGSTRTEEIARVTRRLAWKRRLRDLPVVGALARSVSQRRLQAKRFER